MSFRTPFETLENRLLLSVTAAVKHKKHPKPALPKYSHIVIVMEENHNYDDIFGAVHTLPPVPGIFNPIAGSADDPYIRALAKGGVSFTKASAEAHPSQPNYMNLFSGSSQGVIKDAVPTKRITAPSLGGQLIKAGYTFAGYSEGLPKTGWTGEKSGSYARKHSPWISFTDVPKSANKPFSAFPTNFKKLPTLSFVIPNQSHDMHSGSITAADEWLKKNMSAYANWAKTHNSLLIVNWDEGSGSNHIPTVFFGAHLNPGNNATSINHFSILSTLESMYGLSKLGGAKKAAPITSAFSTTKI